MADQFVDAQSGTTATLQSQDHRNLLDLVDKLRSQGIDHFVDLPQIIVCGDQSSGKSSVLEAISGMSFPTKDNICTRFATELILRRNDKEDVKISINPASDRSEHEKKQLRAFRFTQNNSDIGQVIEAAKEAMGITGKEKKFGADTLCVEISGPSQPHLTMVDLPGLFVAGNRDQTEEDSKLVESLVLSYMKKPRSIILAVVSAKNDFANQQVTRLTRTMDPEGSRTLGLITKPDTLDEGSDSEKFYLEMANNVDVKFRLGWHVVRNRNFAERDSTATERNHTEAEFFATGIWTRLDASQLGVPALKERLSNVLRDQILRQLPSVLQDVDAGIRRCQNTLAKLGESRASLLDQRRYLLQASNEFSSLLRAAIDGVYSDTFFKDDASGSEAYTKRLRALVQNTLADFAEQMRLEGQACVILDDSASTVNNKSRCISRSEYIKDVKTIMKQTRGRELPGTYNPLVVAELFSRQCKPWENLVRNVSERIFTSVCSIVTSVVLHVVDKRTAQSLLGEVIGPSLNRLRTSLNAKVEEILEPHLRGHPITYNHYLTENIHKAQASRNRREMERYLKAYLGTEYLGDSFDRVQRSSLLEFLVSHTEPDMDNLSCAMATDTMEAYYKVAMKKVVDDVSVLAIERCLIQKLPALLCPTVVCDLTVAQIRRIAGETSESVDLRSRTTDKLCVLENAMADLRRLSKLNFSVMDANVHRDSSIGAAATTDDHTEEDDGEPEGPSTKDLLSEETGTPGACSSPGSSVAPQDPEPETSLDHKTKAPIERDNGFHKVLLATKKKRQEEERRWSHLRGV